MFEPLNTRRGPDTRKVIEFDLYQRLWQGYFRGNSGQRWGQYLANGLKLREEDAPGLFFADTVKCANDIFNQYYRLE